MKYAAAVYPTLLVGTEGVCYPARGWVVGDGEQITNNIRITSKWG